jgi:hypothetical protein
MREMFSKQDDNILTKTGKNGKRRFHGALRRISHLKTLAGKTFRIASNSTASGSPA